jgi:hypothetical protein
VGQGGAEAVIESSQRCRVCGSQENLIQTRTEKGKHEIFCGKCIGEHLGTFTYQRKENNMEFKFEIGQVVWHVAAPESRLFVLARKLYEGRDADKKIGIEKRYFLSPFKENYPNIPRMTEWFQEEELEAIDEDNQTN